MAAERRPGRLGRSGELIALALLLLKGYRLRHRNWRGPSGELDLVMEHRGGIVFVEVKTRSSQRFGGAGAAFDRAKRAAVTRTAASYLGRFGLWQRCCRFDLVAIERTGGLVGWRVRHMVDVFEPDRGRLLP